VICQQQQDLILCSFKASNNHTVTVSIPPFAGVNRETTCSESAHSDDGESSTTRTETSSPSTPAPRDIQLEQGEKTTQSMFTEQAEIIKDIEARLRSLQVENERYVDKSGKSSESGRMSTESVRSSYSFFPSPRKLKPLNLPAIKLREGKRPDYGSTAAGRRFLNEDICQSDSEVYGGVIRGRRRRSAARGSGQTAANSVLSDTVSLQSFGKEKVSFRRLNGLLRWTV
jgi:hypothetical protein